MQSVASAYECRLLLRRLLNSFVARHGIEPSIIDRVNSPTEIMGGPPENYVVKKPRQNLITFSDAGAGFRVAINPACRLDRDRSNRPQTIAGSNNLREVCKLMMSNLTEMNVSGLSHYDLRQCNLQLFFRFANPNIGPIFHSWQK